MTRDDTGLAAGATVQVDLERILLAGGGRSCREEFVIVRLGNRRDTMCNEVCVPLAKLFNGRERVLLIQ